MFVLVVNSQNSLMLAKKLSVNKILYSITSLRFDFFFKVGIKSSENKNNSLKDKNDSKVESDSLVDQDDSCSSPVDSSLSDAAWDPRSEASVDLMLSSLKREYLVFINNFKSQAFR